jgi:hypothetical protein
MPSGEVLIGAFTAYNSSRGHLFQFNRRGGFLGAYDFGWDITPAVFVGRDLREHIVIKDNHYGPVPGPFYITQLDANLVPEWKFKSTSADRPGGFEWCVNAPLVDEDGVVYANSEDGRLYAIDQGHHGVFTIPRWSVVLNGPLSSAYTPLSISTSGEILTESDGHLFAIGSPVQAA